MIVRHLTVIAAVSIITAVCTQSAHALTCAESAIEARGEQSRFMWSAKGKARANWRSKVRRTPGLGDAYANWARAQNTDERCLTGPAGTLCIFTGTPCVP